MFTNRKFLDTYTKAKIYDVGTEMSQLLEFRSTLINSFPHMKEILVEALKKYQRTLTENHEEHLWLEEKIVLPGLQPKNKIRYKNGKMLVQPFWMNKCYNPHKYGIFWDDYECNVLLDREYIKCYVVKNEGGTAQPILVRKMSIEQYVKEITSFDYLISVISFLRDHMHGRLP